MFFLAGIEGPFGAALVNPRTLTASFMGQLVMVDGIVTRCMSPHPRCHAPRVKLVDFLGGRQVACNFPWQLWCLRVVGHGLLDLLPREIF